MSFFPAPLVHKNRIIPSVGDSPWTVNIVEMDARQPSQSVSQFRRERLSVSQEFLKASGLEVGQQVLVRIPGHDFKCMTIGHARKEDHWATVRMNADAYDQFRATVGPLTATIEDGVMASNVDEATAIAQGLAREARSAIPVSKDVMVVAPHGGLIEPWTHEQAIRTQQRLETTHSLGAAYYVTQCYPPPDPAHPDRLTTTYWHITAADFRADRGCWPKLAEIWDERFTAAIGYHGMGGEKHVGVGGLASAAQLSGAVSAIAAVLPGDYTVDQIEVNHLDGTSTRNIMNRFAAPGYLTIQLEQTYDARRDYRNEIADALADYMASILAV